jgi:hypothetical protein
MAINTILVLVIFALCRIALAQDLTPALYLPLEGNLGGGAHVKYDATYQPGVRGQALHLDGKDHRLFIPVDPYVSPQGGTLVFWVKKLAGSEYNLMDGSFGNIGQFWWHGNLAYNGKPLPMLMGNWDMLAIACDPQRCTVYSNGQAYLRLPPIPTPTGEVILGTTSGPSEHSTQPAFLLDEVMIFKQALNEQEVFNLYTQTLSRAAMPVAQVGVRKNQLTLDGKVTADKWAGAAQIAGFVDARTGFTAPSPMRAYLLYDQNHLYLGIVSDTPQDVLTAVQATVGMRGYVLQNATKPEELANDDTFSIALAADAAKGAPLYTLTFNNARLIAAQRDGQPITSGATVVTSARLDSGWQAEVVIPWAETGITPQAGQAIGFNLARSWRALHEGRMDLWAWGTRQTDDTTTAIPLGRLLLGGPGDVITRLRQSGDVTAGAVDLCVELENPGTMPRTVKLNIGSGSATTVQERHNTQPGDTWEYTADNAVILAPGERQELRFTTQLTNVNTRRVTFEAKEGDRVIQRAQYSVFMASLTQVHIAHYPSLNILRIKPDITYVAPADLPKLTLEAWITQPGKPNVLAKGTVTAPNDADQWVEIHTDKLLAGQYQAKYRVTNGNDVLLEGTTPYHKRSLASFPWYGNTIGKTDMLPPVFEPVRREGTLLKVWHRSYDVGASLLPTQITNYVPEWSAGWVAAPDLEPPGSSSPTLAAPIRLVLTGADGTMFRSSEGPAQVTWHETKPTRFAWQAVQQVGPAKVTADCFMEFDGFLHIALSIEAQQPIAEAKLEYPYRAAWATLANYYEYHPRNNGRFPDKLEDPWPHSQPIWIGNEVGGTQWLTDDGYVPKADFSKVRRLKEKSPALIMEKTPDAHVMRVMLANQPITAGDTFKVHFALITTPTKPIQTNRLVGSERRYTPAYAFYTNIATHEFDPSHAIGSIAREDETPGGMMTNGGCYVTVDLLCPHSPDVDYWGDDFMGYPHPRKLVQSYGSSMQQYFTNAASPSYVDYFVWWNGAEQVKRNRVAGFYSDCNMRSGGATYLEARELVKRLYFAFLEPNPEGTAVMFHQSGMREGGWSFSFNDAHLDGENFCSLLTKEKPGYHHYYPIDAYRAHLLSYPFGISTSLLDQLGRSGAIATEDAWKKWGSNPVDFFMALGYLHYDVQPAPMSSKQEFVKPWTEAVKEYGLLSTRLPEDRYYPYWTQTIITGLPHKVYASIYYVTKAKRTILIVANYNEQELPLTLHVDWAKLGYHDPSQLKVVRTVPDGQDANIVDGKLQFTLGNAGGRMVVIE